MGIGAVIFDLGGVVVGSPLHAIARFEREHDLPANCINQVVVATGPTGAWSRLERGELSLPQFFGAFEDDCRAAGHTLCARTLMTRVAEATAPRPAMLEAIRRIRAHGLKTGVITNNWVTEEDGASALRPLFDAYIESAAVGIRKPDPRIFEIACQALGITPPEAVFLDDIGSNLKTARALGMTTIRVVDPAPALDELSTVLGFPVR